MLISIAQLNCFFIIDRRIPQRREYRVAKPSDEQVHNLVDCILGRLVAKDDRFDVSDLALVNRFRRVKDCGARNVFSLRQIFELLSDLLILERHCEPFRVHLL